MPSSYTTRNRLTLQEIGANESTWGDILNDVIELTDDALDGILELDITLGNDTLTAVEGGTDESRKRMLLVTNAHTANRQIILPDVEKIYYVRTIHSNGATTTIRNISDLTGITVTATGTTDTVVICDGTETTTFNALPTLGELAYEDFSDVLGRVFPVGSLYVNAVNATNPSDASLLGFGTWAAFGQGRVLIGVGTGTDANAVQETFALDATGGEYEHTLLTAEMPLHKHFAVASVYENGGSLVTASTHLTGESNPSGNAYAYRFCGTATVPTKALTSPSGGDDPHNNIQPYIVVHMWVRIS